MEFRIQFELGARFLGAFRRAITSAKDTVDASVFNYDDALVTLLADTANAYVNYRTDQERIRLLQQQVDVQKNVLKFITEQLNVGFHGVTNLTAPRLKAT